MIDPPAARRSRRGRWSPGRRRGVSTIIATILLLAITVILFSALFYLVGKFPKPGPQPLNQFDASLSYSGSTLSRISIEHLSGTALSGSTTNQAAIYIVSAAHPSAIPSPFTLAAGLSGSSSWVFGQTWSVSLSTYGITSPDNLTVSIVSAGQLEFHTVLAVTVSGFVPYFAAVTVNPTGTIAAAHALYVNATVEFAPSSGDSVTINTTEFPSGSVVSMVGSGGSGTYTYTGTTPSPSSATTYYLILTATDANHLVAVATIAVSVA